MKLNYIWTCVLMTVLISNSNAKGISDPCGGPSALLSLVNRPSVGDSACAVPFKEAILEVGYQYQGLRYSAGQLQNFPQAEFRVGLPYQNEFVLLLPNYVHQSNLPSGFTASTLGIKHEIGYTENVVGSVETLISTSSGSAQFGNKGVGVALNGIVSYAMGSVWNLTFMLGVTSLTTSSAEGGQRFTSVNPDLILTYALTPKANLYAELYGATHTAPGAGSGYNVDGGIIYLLRPYLTVDLELGQRISGNLAGFNQYIGTGLAIAFS